MQVRLQLTGECNPAKPTLRARDIWLVAQRLAVTEGLIEQQLVTARALNRGYKYKPAFNEEPPSFFP